MIKETIMKMELLIKDAKKMDPKRKIDLEALIKELKIELDDLSKNKQEDADSIAGFATVAVHEALRESKDEALIELSTSGLQSSVRKIAASHPKLTAIVRNISRSLSNLGI
ncbi:DUF4404 family protein [bacterium]|jgi:hypothetical protein|nr:DUF4404 family protein [bacterium]